MPRLTEIQTDKTLYPVESPILGYLSEFDLGTERALVTGVEAAALLLEATTGVKRYWAEREDMRQMVLYREHMAAQRDAHASHAEAA